MAEILFELLFQQSPQMSKHNRRGKTMYHSYKPWHWQNRIFVRIKKTKAKVRPHDTSEKI